MPSSARVAILAGIGVLLARRRRVRMVAVAPTRSCRPWLDWMPSGTAGWWSYSVTGTRPMRLSNGRMSCGSFVSTTMSSLTVSRSMSEISRRFSSSRYSLSASRRRGLREPVTTAAAPGCAILASARLARASKSGCSWVTASFTVPQCATAVRRPPSTAAPSGGHFFRFGVQFADAVHSLAGVYDAVFDEHVTRAHATAGGTDDEQAGNAAFKRVRIELSSERAGVADDAARFKQRRVSVIAGEQERLQRRHGEAALRPAHVHRVGRDALHHGVHVRRDRPFLYAVFQVGPHPVFQAVPEIRAPVHHGDARARPVQFQGGIRGAGAGTDDGHILPVKRVGFQVVMRDVGQVLTGHAEFFRVVEVAGGDDDGPRPEPRRGARVFRSDDKTVRLLFDAGHFRVRAHVKPVVVDDLAVAIKRFLARRFVRGSDERMSADFETFGSREKSHVRRVPADGVHYAAFFQDDCPEAGAPGQDGGFQADRSGSDDYHIRVFRYCCAPAHD